MIQRGLDQIDVKKRSGWHSSNVSRIISGKVGLSPASQRVLARIFQTTEAELHQPIGAPIPARLDAHSEEGSIHVQAFDQRLHAVVSYLGLNNLDQLLRFLMTGDYSLLPQALGRRLRKLIEEQNS